LGAVSFLSENKNYVGDQKAGNCPSNPTTSALVGKITPKEAGQPLVDTVTNYNDSNSSNNISNINTVGVQQTGNCPSKTPINNDNSTIEVQQAGNCPSNTSTNNTNNINNLIVLWHNHLAHINPQCIKLMLAGLIMSGSKLAGGVLPDCLAYAQGKSSRKGISKIPVTRATIKFFQMHIDLGIVGIKSIVGNLYFYTITNDYTCT